ncbi:hypothetical protein Psuf_018530 [Phytohabitans suffuscus]|uniref:Uncharacterized protein n=1 Tax=Phytohabitans suffuscus TaxID=624315 RepID=A0A6F8YEP9_9ACTN|nr:hypothetical protein [Phytohabitans suffuscus]BCB84540.1 hypothetical protein Psuf_018530 [Phytohabitans suffuscus]
MSTSGWGGAGVGDHDLAGDLEYVLVRLGYQVALDQVGVPGDAVGVDAELGTAALDAARRVAVDVGDGVLVQGDEPVGVVVDEGFGADDDDIGDRLARGALRAVPGGERAAGQPGVLHVDAVEFFELFDLRVYLPVGLGVVDDDRAFLLRGVDELAVRGEGIGGVRGWGGAVVVAAGGGGEHDRAGDQR